MKSSSLAAGCVLALAAQTGVAADFDGSKPLICAPVQAWDCLPGDTCERGTPAEVGMPNFIRVNVKDKVVQGTERATPIRTIEESETQLLLTGTELGQGWTLALDRRTGDMAISLTNHEGIAVLFGSCTPL
jgi:hypothetical protein